MFLVEKLPAETPRDVELFIEALVDEVYGRRPDWLEYDLCESYTFQGREFIRMSCIAGSVHAHLSLRASQGDGIGRDILQLGTRDGCPRAWLVHRGQRSEHDRREVEATGQQDAAPNSRPRSPLPSSPEVQPSDSLRTPSSGGCG
jgi:hypothetical protein